MTDTDPRWKPKLRSKSNQGWRLIMIWCVCVGGVEISPNSKGGSGALLFALVWTRATKTFPQPHFRRERINGRNCLGPAFINDSSQNLVSDGARWGIVGRYSLNGIYVFGEVLVYMKATTLLEALILTTRKNLVIGIGLVGRDSLLGKLLCMEGMACWCQIF